MDNEIEDFKDMLYGYSEEKSNLIEKDLYLNIFLYDEDYNLRWDVAMQDYGHDILQYDENWSVRYGVGLYTKNKSILEHLSNDENQSVTYRAKLRLKELYGE